MGMKTRTAFAKAAAAKKIEPLKKDDLNYLKDAGLIEEDDMLASGIEFGKPLNIKLTDMLGKDLYPGDIVCFPTGSKLKFAVYAGIQKLERNREEYVWGAGYRGRGRYIKKPYIDLGPVMCSPTRANGKRRNIRKDDWNREQGCFDCAVKIDNPVFHLDKGGIAGCLIIRDDMLDEGMLTEEHLKQEEKERLGI